MSTTTNVATPVESSTPTPSVVGANQANVVSSNSPNVTVPSTTTSSAAPIQVGTSTPIPMDGEPVVLPPKGPEITKPLTTVSDDTSLPSTAPVIAPSSGNTVTPAIVPGNAVPVGTRGTSAHAGVTHPGVIAPDTGAGIVSPISNMGKPGEVNNIQQAPGDIAGFEKCIHCGPEGIHAADHHKHTPTVHAGQLNFDSHGEAYMPKHGANDDRDMSSVTGVDQKTLTHLNEQQRHQAQKNIDKQLMGDSNQGVLDKASAAFGVLGHAVAAKYHGTFVKDGNDTDNNNSNADGAADLKWGGVPQHQIFTPEANSLPMTTKPAANVVVDTPSSASTTTTPSSNTASTVAAATTAAAASSAAASTSPRSVSTTSASSTPASTTAASSTPASTTAASSTPASTTAASSTPAVTLATSTTGPYTPTDSVISPPSSTESKTPGPSTGSDVDTTLPTGGNTIVDNGKVTTTTRAS